jgi:hypothetical protein
LRLGEHAIALNISKYVSRDRRCTHFIIQYIEEFLR